jgi:RNase P/RNase MRP subunit p30
MKHYYDMLVGSRGLAGDAKTLGLSGACFTGGGVKSCVDFEAYSCAVVSGDVRKNAQKALEKYDLVYVEVSSSQEVNRKASECWEVDAFVVSEEYVKGFRPIGKPMFDYVSLNNMTERCIALILPFRIILSCSGYHRATALDCLRRTVFLARKAGVKIVLASGAIGRDELRSPLDLASFGRTVGLPEDDAIGGVSDNPQRLAEKAKDRMNPDVLLAGLKVVDWGNQKPNPNKKKFGWY